MILSDFYFEDILIYVDSPRISKKIIENMRNYFKPLGWELTLISIKNKQKLYFYGSCKKLIQSNYITGIDMLILLGYNEKYLKDNREIYFNKPTDFFKDRMKFEIMSRYLESFSAHFKSFYNEYVSKNIAEKQGVLSKNKNYSLFINGISFVLRIPSPLDDSLEFEIQSYFKEDLEYNSDYDIPPIPLKERIVISSSDVPDSLEAKVILRFSPESRYSLSLHTIPKDLSNRYLYKGISKIALRMFRYLRFNQIEKADQLLHDEEENSLGDLKKINKLKDLHFLLDSYREYMRIDELLEKLPKGRAQNFKGKLLHDKRELELILKECDFFDMCSISEMDFRALELKYRNL